METGAGAAVYIGLEVRAVRAAMVGVFGLVCSLLAAGTAWADGIVIPQTPGEWLTIAYHHVRVVAEDGLVTTHVEQAFRNDTEVPLGGDYVFPLPPGAVVHDFVLWVDGRPVEGKILPADQAREIYLAYLRQNRDPALLEYVGRDAFQARIFPIAPGRVCRVELEYVELVPAELGLYRYRYPLNTERFSARPLEEVRIEVSLRTSRPLGSVFSPSHPLSLDRPDPRSARGLYVAREVLPTDDFLLYYASTADAVGTDLVAYRSGPEDGWFLLMLSPTVSGAPARLPKDLILVVDRSGSMAGEKIAQAKEATKFILQNLAPEDRFGLIAFNEEVEPLTEGLARATVDRVAAAVGAVAAVSADGWTNIHAALTTAMSWLSPADRPQYVVFLTDGLPTAGETETGAIVGDVTAANSAGARLFAFGVGYDVDTHLLDLLAERSRGSSTYVLPGEDLEYTLASFYERIAEPALSELTLEVQGVDVWDMYPQTLPDLFYGSQMVLVGRYHGVGPATVTLTGQRGGGKEVFSYNYVFPEQAAEADFLPRLWAARKIGHLLNRVRLQGESEELVAQIVELGTRYGVATPYTSFLVEEEQRWAMPAAPTGQSAVKAALATQALAAADVVQESADVRTVAGRVFVLRADAWMETSYQEGDPVLEVEYLSPAYLRLLEIDRQVAPILALGEEVLFRMGETYVRVGPSGLTELPPDVEARLSSH
ncbi:MAG: VIT domain-containing protein [Candidatus Bipolaricaulaceae bacterium]